MTQAPPFEPHAAVGHVADDAHVRIVHMRGDRACYSPTADTITMPEASQFTIPSAYEHTLRRSTPSRSCGPRSPR